jgi:hypothetical protein
MTISTYATLKTAVASWAHRGTTLASLIPDFIALAESQIRRDVRCRAMENTASGSLSATTVAIPTGFAEARRVLIGTDLQRYVTQDDWYACEQSGMNQYTIVGDNFKFAVSTGTYQIDYFKWFAALSSDSDTNWVLTNHPDIYLFASLAEAAVWTREDPSIWRDRYAASVAKLRAADRLHNEPLVVRHDVTLAGAN